MGIILGKSGKLGELDALDSLYPSSFFKRRWRLKWRAEILCPILLKIFPEMLESVKESVGEVVNSYQIKHSIQFADIGCGGGEYIHFFTQSGLTTLGVESTTNSIPHFKSGAGTGIATEVTPSYLCIVDITQPEVFKSIIGPKSCALAICLEVGEHLPIQSAPDLVKNLTYLSDMILFSAAGPGQGGHNHVNCRPATYWQELFYDNGFAFSLKRTEDFRAALYPFSHKKELSAYYKNGFVLCNKNLIGRNVVNV
jgi:hypothetical protein